MLFEDHDEYDEDADPLNACIESEICLDCPHFPDCDGCGGYAGRRDDALPLPKRKPRTAPVKKQVPPPSEQPEKMTRSAKVCAGIMGSLFFGLIFFLYLYFYLL